MTTQKFKNSSLKENKTKNNLINSAKIEFENYCKELSEKYNMTIEDVKKELTK